MITSKIPNLLRKKFPTAEAVWEAILRLQFALILITLLLVCCSCGSTKAVTQLVEHTLVDTVYLSNVQYDSIYISQDKLIDRSKDTLYIRDVSVEYRYKLLRDTVRIVQRDSIPYEVTIVQTKEIKRPLTWYDHLSRAILWLNIGFVLLLFVRFIRKLKPPETS